MTRESFTRQGSISQYNDSGGTVDKTTATFNSVAKIFTRPHARDGERRYIFKSAPVTDARREVYGAWLNRLLVLNGATIPRYKVIAAPKANKFSKETYQVGSRMLTGMKSFQQLINRHRSSYASIIADKILAKPTNIRAFAQILVNAIVFKENDLKPDHLVFDDKGNLSRIDFDQTFFRNDIHTQKAADLNFSHLDFENLPNTNLFKPSNFVFLDNLADYDKGERKPSAIQIAHEKAQTAIFIEHLGDTFKTEVYAAILKILVTPDLLYNELLPILGKNRAAVASALGENESASKRIAMLRAEMLKSEKFKEYLHSPGAAVVLATIKTELCEFNSQHKYFRTTLNADAIISATETKFNGLVQATTASLTSAAPLTEDDSSPASIRSSYSVSSTEAGSLGQIATDTSYIKSTIQLRRETTVKILTGKTKTKILCIKGFITEQIARINKSSLSKGQVDKINLYKLVMAQIDAIPDTAGLSDLQLNLNSIAEQVAIISHHRRSMTTHALSFFTSPSESWKAWIQFCDKHKMAEYKFAESKPSTTISHLGREESVTSYNQYRSVILGK